VPFVYGFFPRVYVRYTHNNDKSTPNELNSELYLNEDNYDKLYNYLKFELPAKDIRPGQYLIAVYSTEKPDINSDIVGDFEFMCSRY